MTFASSRAVKTSPLPQFLLLAALAAACSDSAGAPGPGGRTTHGGVDVEALYRAGTRGLVVLNPFQDRPTFWDFDRVPYGAQLKHVYRLRNDEGRDVTVHDLLPTCGCTQATLQYTDASGELVRSVRGAEPVIVLPAGVEFELVIEVDTTTQIERMNVDKLTQVRMRSDAPTVPYMTFELHLVVERTFRAVPAELDLGEIPRGAGKSKRTDVSTELKGVPARITGVERVEGPFRVTADATQLGDEPFWIVVAEAEKDLPLGPVRGRVRLATTKDDGTGQGAPFEIPISGTVVPDVVAHPALFAFGSFPTGQARSATIELVALAPGDAFAIRKSEAVGPGADKLTLEQSAVNADANGRASRWRFTLTTSTGHPFGPFAGEFVIQTDHPRVPEIRVPYRGNAQ
jgi:hypothetical protein